jgi:hypothetical protein
VARILEIHAIAQGSVLTGAARRDRRTLQVSANKAPTCQALGFGPIDAGVGCCCAGKRDRVCRHASRAGMAETGQPRGELSGLVAMQS